ATHWATGRIEALVAGQVGEQVQARLAEERSARAADDKRALELRHDKLLEAQREAEILSSLLVHDMKGPLSTVLMRLELTERDLWGKPEMAAVAKNLRIAKVQGHRLLEMIEDLLAIARLERGALEPRRTRVDMAAMLGSVASTWEALAQ